MYGRRIGIVLGALLVATTWQGCNREAADEAVDASIRKDTGVSGEASAPHAAEERAGQVVAFPEHSVELTVPDGWDVVAEAAEPPEGPYCVVQRSGTAVMPTIAIWASEDFVQDAPEMGNIKPGTAAAAMVQAMRMTLAWASGGSEEETPQTTPVGPGPGSKDPNAVKLGAHSIGGVTFWASERENETIRGYAVSHEGNPVAGESGDAGQKIRPGGALTAACAGPPESWEETKALFDAVLEANVTAGH